MSWAIEEQGYSQRRACGLIGLELKTYRYASNRGGDAAVRVRLLQRDNQDESSASIKVRGIADLVAQGGRSPTGGTRSASA